MKRKVLAVFIGTAVCLALAGNFAWGDTLPTGDSDELQALFDRAAKTESKAVSLERGRTYRVTKTLRLDERHSGLVVNGYSVSQYRWRGFD